VVLCPPRCLDLSAETNSKGYPIAVLGRPAECTGCEICGHVCPHWAIDVYRTVKTPQSA
jgi:2-oxoglutarate ferredoxin oxidoreductase subunit delta